MMKLRSAILALTLAASQQASAGEWFPGSPYIMAGVARLNYVSQYNIEQVLCRNFDREYGVVEIGATVYKWRGGAEIVTKYIHNSCLSGGTRNDKANIDSRMIGIKIPLTAIYRR